MPLFSSRFVREHFPRREPDYAFIQNPSALVEGDLLVYDEDTTHFIPTTPTLPVSEVGTLGIDGEILVWNETSGVWEAGGFVVLEPAYGHIYAQDAAVAQAVTAAPAKVTAFAADGVSNLTTPDNTSDSITILENGIYEVELSVTYTYGAAAVVQMHVLVDAAESVLGFKQETLNAGDVMTAHAHAPLALVASEVVTVYVEADADSNITISDISLSVRRIDNYIPVI